MYSALNYRQISKYQQQHTHDAEHQRNGGLHDLRSDQILRIEGWGNPPQRAGERGQEDARSGAYPDKMVTAKAEICIRQHKAEGYGRRPGKDWPLVPIEGIPQYHTEKRAAILVRQYVAQRVSQGEDQEAKGGHRQDRLAQVK